MHTECLKVSVLTFATYFGIHQNIIQFWQRSDRCGEERETHWENWKFSDTLILWNGKSVDVFKYIINCDKFWFEFVIQTKVIREINVKFQSQKDFSDFQEKICKACEVLALNKCILYNPYLCPMLYYFC